MLSPYDVSEIGFSALSRIQQRHFDQDFRPGIIVKSVYPAGDNASSTNMNILDDWRGDNASSTNMNILDDWRGYY